jgi:peptide/nickel transport system permease protein
MRKERKQRNHLSPSRVLWNNKLTLLAIIAIASLALTGLFAGAISQFDPYMVDTSIRLLPPGGPYLFGTDAFGRDIFTRVIYGARISLWMGLFSVGISFIIGVGLGGASGYFGRRLGVVVMRFMDALSAFPSLILAITISTIIGRGVMSAIISVGIVGIPEYARLMFSQAISVKKLGFVESAYAIGVSGGRILIRHVLPNCLPALVVKATNGLGGAILTISALSFLGMGAQPPTAEWGAMISDSRGYIISGEWWTVMFPGLAILLAVLSFNLMGDGLRDIMDPHAITGGAGTFKAYEPDLTEPDLTETDLTETERKMPNEKTTDSATDSDSHPHDGGLRRRDGSNVKRRLDG